MKKIEFIGASGVGKTTLFKEMLLFTENRIWKTPSEARIEIARNMKFDNFKGLKLLRLLCLKLDILKNKHSNMAIDVLDKYMAQLESENIYKYNEIIDLMLKALFNDYDFDAYRKAEFIKFYMDMLKKDIIALEFSDYNNFVVYEDGILHNSIGLDNEKYFNYMVHKNPGILEIIIPKGVVFCQLSLEENIARRNKRINSGFGTILENNYSQETILEICMRDLDEANSKVDLIKKYGVPILNIDTSKPIKDNVKKVDSFISNIQING
ncbi:MAG: hypothetical protein ACM3X7_04180 [Solirubrobacterales bacterium]